MTFIASDASAGNSYAAKQVRFVIKPKVHAHITCGKIVGPAPLTVKVSAEGSQAAGGEPEFGWEFYAPAPGRKPAPWKEQSHEPAATHSFAKPGLYEVALTVKSGEQTDRETLSIWVTDGPCPTPSGGIAVEGNGARVADDRE